MLTVNWPFYREQGNLWVRGGPCGQGRIQGFGKEGTKTQRILDFRKRGWGVWVTTLFSVCIVS